MSSRQAAEVRLLALEHKAFLTWLKGGVDVLLSFKKARDLEKFVFGLEEIIDHYISVDCESLFLDDEESDPFDHI